LIGDTPDDIAAVIAAGGRGIGVRTPLDQAHVSYYIDLYTSILASRES
jgi:phosphoglycolate phosphatase-like HAD superfamily hydrolase